MMKVVNAYKRKRDREREREKEQKGICIYLCCCLHVDQASLLLSLVPSIVIDCRKYFFLVDFRTIVYFYC